MRFLTLNAGCRASKAFHLKDLQTGEIAVERAVEMRVVREVNCLGYNREYWAIDSPNIRAYCCTPISHEIASAARGGKSGKLGVVFRPR